MNTYRFLKLRRGLKETKIYVFHKNAKLKLRRGLKDFSKKNCKTVFLTLNSEED